MINMLNEKKRKENFYFHAMTNELTDEDFGFFYCKMDSYLKQLIAKEKISFRSPNFLSHFSYYVLMQMEFYDAAQICFVILKHQLEVLLEKQLTLEEVFKIVEQTPITTFINLSVNDKNFSPEEKIKMNQSMSHLLMIRSFPENEMIHDEFFNETIESNIMQRKWQCSMSQCVAMVKRWSKMKELYPTVDDFYERYTEELEQKYQQKDFSFSPMFFLFDSFFPSKKKVKEKSTQE